MWTKRKIIWSLKSEKVYTPKTKPVRQLSQNLQALLTDSLPLPWLQSSQCLPLLLPHHPPALFLGAFQQFSDWTMWIQINERSNNTLFLFFIKIILPTDQKLMGSNIWDQSIRKQEEDKSNKSSFSQSLPSKRLTLCLTYIFCPLKKRTKPKKLSGNQNY